MPVPIFATSMVRRDLVDVWFLSHLYFCLMPPLETFLSRRRRPFTLRDGMVAVAIAGVVASLTWDVWAMVLEEGRTKEYLKYWWDRCAISNAIVLGTSVAFSAWWFSRLQALQENGATRRSTSSLQREGREEESLPHSPFRR